MLKKGGLGWTIWNVLLGVLLVVGGILCCACSGDYNFQKPVILILGILIIVDASFRLLTQVIKIFSIADLTVIKTDSNNAVIGASELAIGILMIFVHNEFSYANIVFRYLAYFVGILFVVGGVVGLIYGIVFLIRKHNSVLTNVLEMLVAACLILLGIIIMIYLPDPGTALRVFFILSGIILIIFGLILTCATAYIAVRLHKDAKALKAKAKEAEEPKEE